MSARQEVALGSGKWNIWHPGWDYVGHLIQFALGKVNEDSHWFNRHNEGLSE